MAGGGGDVGDGDGNEDGVMGMVFGRPLRMGMKVPVGIYSWGIIGDVDLRIVVGTVEAMQFFVTLKRAVNFFTVCIT